MENPFRQLSNRKYLVTALLLLGWLALAFVVNPLGEFPLNDDWAYALNVYALSEKGVFELSSWPAMTLIAQTLFGTGVVTLAGFSFTALRLSVLLIAGIGLVSLFQFLLARTETSWSALLVTLVVVLNPLFFSLSYTFMTDVPFLVLCWSAISLYQRSDQKGHFSDFWWASLLVLLATMIRQLGLAIPLAGLISTLWMDRRLSKKLLGFLLSFLVSLAVFLAYQQYISRLGFRSHYDSTFQSLLKEIGRPGFFPEAWKEILIVMQYLGIFLLPISILTTRQAWRSLDSGLRLWFLLGILLMAWPMVQQFKAFPCHNIIHQLGIGPRVIRDVFSGENGRVFFSGIGLFAIRLTGILGGLGLLFNASVALITLFRPSRGGPKDSIPLICFVLFLAFLAFIVAGEFFFDRYFLMLIPLILVIVLPVRLKPHRLEKAGALVVMVAWAWFSVAGTQDYLSWNRARWEGLHSLMAKGVPAERIDGGFEFNGWFETGGHARDSLVSWWFVADDDYLATHGRYRGYRVHSVWPYFSLLAGRHDSAFICQRIPTGSCDTTWVTCGAEFRGPKAQSLASSDPYTWPGGAGGRTQEIARTGSFSVRCGPERPYAFTTFLAMVSGGECISLSVFAKGDPSRLRLVAEGIHPDGFRSEGTTLFPRPDGWNLLSHSLIVPKQTTPRQIRFYVENTGNHEVFLDDLIVRRVVCK